MSDYDTIRECVSIYCEWLTCLTSPKKCVPIPILEDRNAYAQEILNHLYNIFVPRLDSGESFSISLFTVALIANGLHLKKWTRSLRR